MTTPAQPEVSPFAGVSFSDKRGGVFFIVDNARVHGSDLTDAQRSVLAAEDTARAVAMAPAPAPANLSPADVSTSNG